MRKIILFLNLALITVGCKPLQNKIYGTWEIVGEVRTDDAYTTRDALTEKRVKSKKTLTINKDSTFVSNLMLCNNWTANDSQISKGVIHFNKSRNPDKLFWLECPKMYHDHFFLIKNNRLELILPSVTGYQIQIFEKIK